MLQTEVEGCEKKPREQSEQSAGRAEEQVSQFAAQSKLRE